MNKVALRILLGMGSCVLAAGFVKLALPSSSRQRNYAKKSTQVDYHSENLQRHILIPKIEDDNTRQGILVVGDVHGCLEELKELHEVAMRENDGKDFHFVILVGDLVNKGPFSAEVVQYIQEKQVSGSRWLAVRGNHDNGALAAAKGDEKRRQNPTYHWIDRLSEKDIAWLESLPYTIRIPKSFWEEESERDILVVHAGLVSGIPLAEQTIETMVTIRNIDERPWASVWHGPEHVIFGHDARRGIQEEKFATGLDSGACYGKRLTGILLPRRLLVNVSSRRVYEEVSGK